MRRCNLLLIIAAVAAWPVLGSSSKAQPLSAAKPPRIIAAEIEALIRANLGNSELVTFADGGRHPVRIVRGKRAAPPSAAMPGADEIVPLSGKEATRVPIMRGGPAPRVSGGDVQVVVFDDRSERPVTVLRGTPAARIDVGLVANARSQFFELFDGAPGADLDRIAFAVDGAESSHGTDPAMWRAEPDGPQGPMQVSVAAAADTGGGDRFDVTENRLLGRAYLAHLYGRYGNWPDTVAAYNWGPGNMDAWIAQGRPSMGLPLAVERYRDRVLRDGRILSGPAAPLSHTKLELPAP